MRKLTLTAAAGVFVALGATSALAMGGQGGPSDAWGSPYALYAPQTFHAPPGWGPVEGRSVYEGQGMRMDCRGDRACEQRMRRTPPGAAGPQY